MTDTLLDKQYQRRYEAACGRFGVAVGRDPADRRLWGLVLALLTTDADLWHRVEPYLDPPFFVPLTLSGVTPYQELLLTLARQLMAGQV